MKSLFPRFRRQSRLHGITSEDVWEAVNSGKFIFVSILFLLGFSWFSSATFSWLDLVDPRDPQRTDRLLATRIMLALGAIAMVGTYLIVRQILIRAKERGILADPVGLIVLSRYGPECRQAVESAGRSLKHVVIIETDIARGNYREGRQVSEATVKALPKGVQGEIFEVPDRNSAVAVSGQVLAALLRMESDNNIDHRHVIIDVTDLPGHIFVRLVQEFGARIQCFQVIQKQISDEGAAVVSQGNPVSDRHYIPGKPIRFRVYGVKMQFGADPDPTHSPQLYQSKARRR